MSEETKDMKPDEKKPDEKKPDEKKSDKKQTDKKRCFVMMPISDQGDYPKGHFQKVYEQIFIPAIENAGYEPYRVDENTISDSIINKIFEAIQKCEMALCDLSNRNPNVLYELGLRQAYNKPVVLVKDEKTESIFDVSVISTIPYNSNRLYENVLEAQERIKESLISTGEGEGTSLIQFVRAREASYDDVKVNKDDSVNIMLQSIMKELQRLNSGKEAASKKYTKKGYYVEIRIQIQSSADWKEINDAINFLNEIVKEDFPNVAYLESSDEVRITIPEKDYFENRNVIINMIETKIGKIIKILSA